MAAIKTLCGGCAMGCGVRAFAQDDRRAFIEGDRIHPVNMGWLCPVGEALAQGSGLEERLLYPALSGRSVGRDRAIAHAARRLSETVARFGPQSVALHVAGDLPTEDYYAANKWMKGFIGSANIGTPWRDIAGPLQRAAFGEDVVAATLEDVDRADLFLVLGAGSLLGHPALHRRVSAARTERGAMLVLIDAGPAAGQIGADLHLIVQPRAMAALLGGVQQHGRESGGLDRGFIDGNVAAPDGYWDALRPGHDIWSVARTTGLPVPDIRAFYDLVGATPTMVTLLDPDHPESPVTRETAAIALNLHLATGRIGKAGAGPLLLPGAANAMGAREVGCASGTLAAHRDFSPAPRAAVIRFWSAPCMAEAPGLSGDPLAQAIRDGGIQALVMLGDAPSDLVAMLDGGASLPFTLFAGDRIDPALAGRIDLALPMAGPLERDGTLTGADRLISRQRPVFPLPGEARPGWWIVTRIARAMGWHDAFYYERPADIYREHARLSAYQDDRRRLFNLRRHAPVSNPAYQELTPWRWGEAPFHDGRFPSGDGRARLVV